MKNCITEQFWCVKQIHIFRDLAGQDVHALERITTFQELKHEERLSAEGVYLLKAGRVKIYENLSDTEPETKEVFFNDEKTAQLELCGAGSERFK